MLQTSKTPIYAKQYWPITRQFERRTVEARVTLEVSGQRYRGWSIDLCEGGIGLMCPAPLRVGQEVSAAVELAPEVTIHFRAVIRHSQGFRHGGEFLTIASQDRAALARFLAEKPVRRAGCSKTRPI
jgi:PilZ domain